MEVQANFLFVLIYFILVAVAVAVAVAVVHSFSFMVETLLKALVDLKRTTQGFVSSL